MIPAKTFWQLEVCNACRYCEGYCAVFPALERRRRFTPGDVVYLANLCHDCRACFYACMYAPPHEFGVNIPKALAEVREYIQAKLAGGMLPSEPRAYKTRSKLAQEAHEAIRPTSVYREPDALHQVVGQRPHRDHPDRAHQGGGLHDEAPGSGGDQVAARRAEVARERHHGFFGGQLAQRLVDVVGG